MSFDTQFPDSLLGPWESGEMHNAHGMAVVQAGWRSKGAEQHGYLWEREAA